MPMFHCPSCGTEARVGEEFAGKHVLCPKCQQSGPVATPQGITPPELAHGPLRRAGDELPETPPSIRDPEVRMRPLAWLTLGKVLLAISFCIIGPLAVAFFVPPVQKGRENAAIHHSINNLKQIGLACHAFHDANKRLPFNGSDLAAGGQLYSKHAVDGGTNSGSWLFQILPYIDQEPIFNTVNRTRPVPVYLCPGRGRKSLEEKGGAWSDYFYNNYINDPKQATTPDAADMRRSLPSVADGISVTVLAGHGNIDTQQYAANANVTLCSNIFTGGTFGTARGGQNGESAPEGVTLQRDSAQAPTPASWGGPFPQGALMVMGDATVHFFPYNTKNFSSFLTPTGKEAVVLPDS